MRIIALFVIAIAAIVVAIIALRGGEDTRESRERAAALDGMHDEALETLATCTDRRNIAMSGAATRTQLRDAIDRTLAPAVDAAGLACATVDNEIGVVLAERPTDGTLVAARVRVAEATAHLARVRAAMAHLRAALAGDASDDAVGSLVATLRSALRD